MSAVCAGITGALTMLSGGSIGDALQAMAFTVASAGIWQGVGNFLEGFKSLGIGAFTAIKSAVHGVVGGALAMVQGGSFMDGFVANAVGAMAGVASERVFGPAGTGGTEGLLGRTAMSAVAGGTASVLTGGKFANAAITAAFAHMWNDELHFNGKKLTWVDDNGRIVAEYEAVSGKPGYYSKEYQDLAYKGPIPEGEWDVKQSAYESIHDASARDMLAGLIGRGKWPGTHTSWGDGRIWLTPRGGTMTYRRSGFSIHGGTIWGSAGCVDMRFGFRAFIQRFRMYEKDLVMKVRY